ncbi:MAG: nuclear transport factor 2 family protein [Solirubrobacterales bacterium]
MPRLLLGCLLCVLALGACGGGDGSEDDGQVPGGADPAEAQVIDDWARTLSEGDVDGAARYFAIPSVAENGPTLIRIRDLDDARLFNATLPCGAELVRAESEGDFVVATFRLTERPGPGTCGDGAGGAAQTAFVIEDGRIAEWRRVGIGGDEQAPSRSI